MKIEGDSEEEREREEQEGSSEEGREGGAGWEREDETERQEQEGEMGGEGITSRGKNCILTHFHKQVCLLISLGCFM